MEINDYGAVFLTPEELFENIYTNKIKNFKNIYLDQSTVEQFNTAKNTNKDSFEFLSTYKDPDLSIKDFDLVNQRDWFMPAEYKTMDIEGFLVDQCPRQNHERLIEEIQLFRQHNMVDLLRYLKYLVDTMRANKIVWGVGRGSSVASYCLYLIGVHKIDSIKYNLDIKEFLK
jgi:DNA polymerase III alpha subunit